MNNTTHARSTPTKQLFVSMLTKDIELDASILDLIDNSVDGAIRSRGNRKDYSGYYIHVNFDANEFSIKDNCGGIHL